jgi:hypothetical protein
MQMVDNKILAFLWYIENMKNVFLKSFGFFFISLSNINYNKNLWANEPI